MKLRWLDFSHYGMNLMLVKVPSGAHFMVLRGAGVAASTMAAAHVKFRHQKDSILIKAAKLRKDGSIENLDIEECQRHFPDVRVVEFEEGRHYENRENFNREAAAVAATGATAASASQDKGAVQLAFQNRLGHDVFESEDGSRWSRDRRGSIYLEKEASPANPGLYLRAKDDHALAACADGLVEMAGKGKILRAADFDQFLKVIYPFEQVSDERRATVRQAIVASMERWRARENAGKSMQEAFIKAGKLHESMPFMSDGVADHHATPGLAAIVAQRLLGNEAQLRGKKVVISSEFAGPHVTKLPPVANVAAYSVDAKRSEETRGVLSLAGLKQAASHHGRADFSDADATIFDHVAKHGDTAVKVAGRSFTRADYAEVIRTLDVRANDGASVFLLDAPEPGNLVEESEYELLCDHIAKHYVLEGRAEIDRVLYRGGFYGTDRAMLVVGEQRQEPAEHELAEPARPINDWSALWTWGAELISARVRKVDPAAPAESGAAFSENDKSERNPFQTPYVSASRVGTPSTMVPRNLEGPTRSALERVVAAYGDIDEFVALEFGYTVDELKEIFSPEQIDALALFVYAEHRGRGFLVADETGIGKGRTLAAIMRRSVMNGRKPLFLTERETNLSDIWRDIVATKSDSLFSPLLVNTDGKIIDRVTRQVLVRGGSRDEFQAVANTGKIPSNVNLVLGTYSQFNRDVGLGTPGVKEPSIGKFTKSWWFAKVVDKDVDVILDESHNAAGDGNIATNVEFAVDQANNVVYSSATYAASADRLAFYSRLFPRDLSNVELSSMMARGGDTFLEVLSSMLVHDGVMIRREFDLSRVEFETVMDTERFERNRAYMDAVAPVLAEIAGLSAAIDQKVRELNARNAAPARENEGGGVPPASKFHITRTGFGSPLYTISRLFVAAMKVDATVEHAIADLKEGAKPVIMVENTMQQLMEELAGGDMDEPVEADFRALCRSILRRTTLWTMTDSSKVSEGGEVIKHKRDWSNSDPVIAERVAKIDAMIERMPDITVSVIDEVKKRISEAGYTIDEITGRTLEIRDGKIMRRPPGNTTMVKNDFNDGVIDVLILNTAGSTGIDLHASKTFKDQRRRVLTELQPPADIVRKMQGRGRINRYDQVVDPKVRSIVSGLPIEMRLNAMENAKLRRLSANTTSNRDASYLSKDIPDLINPIGDEVCARYAAAHPALMRRLGFRTGLVENVAEANLELGKVGADEFGKDLRERKFAKELDERQKAHDAKFRVADTKRTANELLARLIMLPVDLQTKVSNELTAEFHAAVEEMEARGETPLRANALQGIVHLRDQSVFDGASVTEPDSVFQEPLYVVNAALERTGKAMSSDDVIARIELGEMGSGRAQPCIERLRRDQDEILQAYLPDGIATVSEALSKGSAEVIKRKDRLDRLASVLADIRPGKEVFFSVDGEATSGIVTRVEYPARGYEHVPELYGLEFVVPGDERPRTMRLETILRDPAFKLAPGVEGANYEDVLKKFDYAVSTKLTSIRLLTHNIFRAMRLNVEHRLGTLVSFQLPDGTVHRAVAISKRHNSLKSVPVEMINPEMAEFALVKEYDLYAAQNLDEKGVSIRKTSSELFELRLPALKSKKYGFVYDSKYISDLLKRVPSATSSLACREIKGGYVVAFGRDELKVICKELYAVGAKLWGNALARDFARQYLTDHHHNQHNDTPEMEMAP